VSIPCLPGALEAEVSTFVPLLDAEQAARLPLRAREVVEYRKSGLSLNHIQGCPLDCAYCVRHIYGLWDQRRPRALMPDAEAVDRLVSHRYFQAHVTPIQVLNQATDPFLPPVRAYASDARRPGQPGPAEPRAGHHAAPDEGRRYRPAESAGEPQGDAAVHLLRYRDKRIELYPSVAAAVFTGLYYRDQIAQYYRDSGLPDYNGHYGIRELCDICPVSQASLCRGAHRVPSAGQQPPDLVELAVPPITDGTLKPVEHAAEHFGVEVEGGAALVGQCY
jgi:hypothetical protein